MDQSNHIYGPQFVFNKSAAEEADIHVIYGRKIIEITQAAYFASKSGAYGIDLRGHLVNKSGSVSQKEIKFDPIWIQSGSAKGNEIIPTGYAQFASLVGIVTNPQDGTAPRVDMAPGMVYDPTEGKEVEKPIEQFVELLGRRVGVLIKTTIERKSESFNVYSAIPVNRNEWVGDPDELVYMESQTGEAYPRYRIAAFFDPDTGQTYAERNSGSTPKDIAQMEKGISTPYERHVSDTEFREALRKKGKAQLGHRWNEDLVQKFADDDEVPADWNTSNLPGTSSGDDL